MKIIYNMIKRKAWSQEKKNSVFLLCNMLFFAFIGWLLWFLWGRWALPVEGWRYEWAFCFIGGALYLGGFLGGMIFLFNYNPSNVL